MIPTFSQVRKFVSSNNLGVFKVLYSKTNFFFKTDAGQQVEYCALSLLVNRFDIQHFHLAFADLAASYSTHTSNQFQGIKWKFYSPLCPLANQPTTSEKK